MRQALLVVGLLSMVSCGSGDRSLPATPLPSPNPAPSPGQTLTLSGTVSETAPTTSNRIGGVRVDVFCCGANAGRSATTDSNGVFQLGPLEPGVFTIRALAANYIEASQTITLTGHQTVAIEINPVFQMVTNTTNESISIVDGCPGFWDDPDGRCEANFVFNVHHDGSLTAAVTTADRDASFALELYRADGGIILSSAVPWRPDGSALVHAHNQYRLRVRQFAVQGGPRVTPFRLTVTRPS